MLNNLVNLEGSEGIQSVGVAGALGQVGRMAGLLKVYHTDRCQIGRSCVRSRDVPMLFAFVVAFVVSSWLFFFVLCQSSYLSFMCQT